MKRFIMGILLTLISGCLFSQYSVGLLVNSGIGHLKYKEKWYESQYDVWLDKPQLSYSGGIFGQYRFSDLLSIEVEALYNKINSVWYSKNFSSNFQTERRTETNYFMFPVTMGFTFKKLTLNLGFQYSFLNKFHYTYKSIYEYNGQMRNDVEETNSRVWQITDVDAGFVFKVQYKIFDKLNLELRFNQGFTDLAFFPRYFAKQIYSRQLLFGFKYNLFSKIHTSGDRIGGAKSKINLMKK